MLSTLVALDLETTGLNAERDAIIEVAAVRFSGSEVQDEYTTLVRPEVEIPFRVSQLTGLTDEHLEHAPGVHDVLPQLVSFVGNDPVVGHSVDHDLSFLQRYGALVDHSSIDTFELASILVPEAQRYALGALASHLRLEMPDQLHRALADAHLHRLLYEALFNRARRLGAERLGIINRLAQGIDWQLAKVFHAAADSPSEDSETTPVGLPAPEMPDGFAPLVPAAETRHVPADKLAQLIAPGGPLAQSLDGYEDRPGQRTMLEAVCESFRYGDQLLVEAGTGIGKSLAYLLPAAAWAAANGRHVVIATHTINLQEQLLNKDLPTVRDLLGNQARGVVLKGRANYLCRARLESVIAQGAGDVDSLRALVKLVVWQTVTQTGDRSELLLQREEAATWRRVNSEGQVCSIDRCEFAAAGRCWLHRARNRAEAAHVVVVNHALLVSDMLIDNRILPSYDRLIVDEAHHLEDVATAALGVHVDLKRIQEVLAILEARGSGLLPLTSAAIAKSQLPDEARRKLGAMVGAAQRSVLLARPAAASLFDEVEAFLAEHSGGRAQKLRLTDATRAQPAWLSVEKSWDGLLVQLGELRTGLRRLGSGITSGPDGIEDEDALALELGGAIRELAEIESALQRTISRPSRGDILWASRGEGGRPALHAAPLHVGEALAQSLYRDKETIVLTSATLRTGEGFSYIRDRLGLPDASEHSIPSPFDYSRQALLFVPTDMPAPDRQDHQHALDQVLAGLCLALRGRTLVLYTSYAGLKRSYRSIVDPLGKSGIAVLGQGIDGGRQKLLNQFREADCPTVLLGTRSFWEGIDVPGPALSCLVITRLPFDVPTDPIVEARAETFDEPFREYSVPQAILRFRQGFGRLVRSADDSGVIAVLDSRVRSKFYGQWFLDALPPCERQDGPLSTLPAVAARFLDGHNSLDPWGDNRRRT